MSYGLPDASSYSEAIQDVRNLNVPFLQNARHEKNAFGVPFSNSGQNAVVYRLRNNAGSWAVRCFLSYDESQTMRYPRLSQFFTNQKIEGKYFMNFQYYQQGIRVQRNYYPVLTMRWIDGLTLDKYISLNYHDPRKINILLINFLRMLAFLRYNHIAHGDLQHGNILILGDKPYLIDYDGMFIPEFEKLKSVEIGHPDYQHPFRSNTDFSANTDNFSAWVILASLAGVMIEPRLWEPSLCDLSNDGSRDHLLFCRDDYLNPEKSIILSKLMKSQHFQLRTLGELLRSFIISPHIIPSPVDFKKPNFNEDGSWVAQFISDLVNPASLQRAQESYLTYDVEPEFFDKVVKCPSNLFTPPPSTVSQTIPNERDLNAIDRELGLYEKATAQAAKAVKTAKVVGAANVANVANQGAEADKLYAKGCWLLMNRNFYTAADALQKAIDLRPNHPDSHYMLGQALENIREFTRAMAHYQIAVKLKANYAEAHLGMGELMRNNLPHRNIRASMAHYENAIKYKSNYFEALHSLGKAHNSLREYDDAIIYLEQAKACASTHRDREAVEKNLRVARLRGRSW